MNWQRRRSTRPELDPAAVQTCSLPFRLRKASGSVLDRSRELGTGSALRFSVSKSACICNHVAFCVRVVVDPLRTLRTAAKERGSHCHSFRAVVHSGQFCSGPANTYVTSTSWVTGGTNHLSNHAYRYDVVVKHDIKHGSPTAGQAYVNMVKRRLQR